MPDPALNGLSRRAFLLWGQAAVLGGTASATHARGGGRDPIEQIPKHDSQSRFARLSRTDIQRLQSAVIQGQEVTIDGFSAPMSARIVYMANRRRGMTRRLVRDMRRLTTPEQRAARLDEEIREFEHRVDVLDNALNSLSRSDADLEIWLETKGRLYDAQSYLDDVRYWRTHPQEGQY